MVRQPIDEHGGGGENRLPLLLPRAADASSELDGTIVLRIHAGSSLDASLTGEVTRAHIELARGRKCPVLVDVRGLVSIDRAS
ncbi:MAG TPA: hypothetical protein VNN80_12630, partial [Polyangiaceae bacterium]|nr:hypothetical protein [Polyangiaceae bacterium]